MKLEDILGPFLFSEAGEETAPNITRFSLCSSFDLDTKRNSSAILNDQHLTPLLSDLPHTASWACRQIPPDVLRSDWLSKLFPHWPRSPRLIFLSYDAEQSAEDCGWSSLYQACPPVSQLAGRGAPK